MIKSNKHDGRSSRRRNETYFSSRDRRYEPSLGVTKTDGLPTRDHDSIPHFAKFDGQNIVISDSSSSKRESNTNRSGSSRRSSSARTGMRRGDFHMVRGDNDGGAYDAEAAATYKWAKHEATNSMSVNQTPCKDPMQKLIRKPSGGLLRSNSVGGRGRHDTPSRRPFSMGNVIPQSAGDYAPIDNGGASRIPPLEFRTRTRSQSPRLMSSFKEKSRNATKNRSASAHVGNRPIIASSRNLSPAPKQKLSEEEEILKKNYASKKYTFQTPVELVTCRTIALNSRAAFEKKRLVSVSDLHEAAKKMKSTENGKRNGSSSDISNQLNKLSPSPYHVEILETMGNITETRQLCWSLGVTQEADPFHGWDVEGVDDDAKLVNSDSMKSSTADRARRRQLLLAKKRRDIAAKRVGGYKQIDPTKYVRDNLPNHEPQLTNVKRRLPVRSDVGFPGATEEEIMMKQSEIAKEAQLEEISPRLVVLLTGDDVGLSPHNAIDELIDNKCLEKQEYRLPGIPFATKNLTAVKNQTVKSIVRNQRDVDKERNRLRILKPDRNSVFSPPVDATSSSTQIWRPRPFIDRAPGMRHILAIPLDVRFGVGNIEPLVCTLSLYCLPKGRSGGKATLRGKISEDFVFPGGNWGDMLEEKAGKILAKQFGMNTKSKSDQNMCQKLKKAMFSFDPIALQNSSEGGGLESLYLFMEVHRVANQDASEVYLDHMKDQNSSYSKRNSMGGLFFGGKSSSSSSHRGNLLDAEHRAKTMFDKYGMKFLTPFCFGILPLFSNLSHDAEDSVHWPHGATQTMQFFSQDVSDEPVDRFIDKLESIAQFVCDNPVVADNLDLSLSRAETDSVDSTVSNDSSGILKSSSEDKRSYRRGRKHKHKASAANGKSHVPDDVTRLCGAKFIDGSARFYISLMGSDFSQALLQSPACLNLGFNGQASKSPRLFVDPTGDSAIMMNPDQKNNSSLKRSNLIRLPPANIPSGYADSSEFREVLYLPPDLDKRIDSILPQTIRNPLNLLYICPRMIKDINKNGVSESKKPHTYSVRIRLVQQEVRVDKSGATVTKYRPDRAIHNPCLLGDPIVEAAYTKLPLNATSKKLSSMVDNRIYLRDEFKIRLPNVLDGKYFLQFSLYSVDINNSDNENAGLKHTLVAETLIPLSSSSTKEAINGTKVSTVIPNGIHRIKLSDFQLDIQSRLVSHVHISDPAVATVMRDFAELHHNTQKSSNIIPYNKILSKASQEAIINHFRPLLFMHIRSFFSQGKLVFSCSSRQAPPTKHNSIMIEVMKSLLELIRKVKKLTDSGDTVVKEQTKRLLKITLDDYDDLHFDLINNKVNAFEPGTPRIITSDSEKSLDSKQGGEIVDNSFESEDIIDPGSQDIAIQANIISGRIVSKDERLREMYASLNQSTPITRKAYGFSKIDVMKAEAELHETGQVFSELADDDETIVTATTFQSHAFMTSSHPAAATRSYDMASVSKIDLRDVIEDSSGILETVPIHDESNETPLERAKQMAR